MICGSGGSKSRLAKAAGAEPAGQMSDEKLHAVVARSRFPSQNVQNTPVSDHFWKLRCQKSARRCGAKHICKSKCRKHLSSGPLLEVAMSKKCTPLWREAHFQVKMQQNTPLLDHFWKLRCRKSARRCGAKHISKSKCTKHTRFGPLLEVSDVEKVHAVVVRSTFRSQNVQNTTCSRHFWRFGCRKSARRCGAKDISKSKCTKTLGGLDNFWRFRCRFASLRVITLLYTLHYTTVHYTTLHSTTLQLQLQNYTTTLHYTPLHYINYNTLRHITLHSTTLHYITLHYTLHYTTLHYTTHTLHTLQYITLHYTPQHYNYNYRTTQLHSTTLHYTPLH